MFDKLLDGLPPGGVAGQSCGYDLGWDAPSPEWAAEPASPLPDVPPEAAALSECVPSGWLALELDTATAVEDVLDDADLVDAIVGFDRVSSWACARQARLLAEFARRRPGDDPAAVMAEC